MPRYLVEGHPLLSDDAARLGKEAIDAQADIAETVLLLDDISFEEGDPRRETATLAIVRQINYQVATGSAAYVLAAESEGDQSRTYRVGGERGLMPAVDPVAWRLARRAHPIRTRFVP